MATSATRELSSTTRMRKGRLSMTAVFPCSSGVIAGAFVLGRYNVTVVPRKGDGKASVVNLGNGLSQVMAQKWLLNANRAPIIITHAFRAVAAGKQERNAAFAQHVSNGKAQPTIKVDVQNGKVKVTFLRQRKRLIKACRDACHLIAQFKQER